MDPDARLGRGEDQAVSRKPGMDPLTCEQMLALMLLLFVLVLFGSPWSSAIRASL